MDISPLSSSISCILNFHLGYLNLFGLCVMVNGFIIVAVTYIISFKTIRFGLKSSMVSSMVSSMA